MKEYIFNKKDYASYEDMYKDFAVKFGCNEGLGNYYDLETFEFNPNILLEFLLCEFAYKKKSIKITLIGFDKEKISNPKNVDDYEFSLIFQTLEIFIKEYPNNIIEYKNEK